MRLLGPLLAALLLSACSQDVAPPSEALEATPSATPTRPPKAKPKPVPAPPSITVPQLSVPPRLAGPVVGGDVSWPQCPKGMGIPEKPGKGLAMPLPRARFVIFGLTNGPAFTPNPCLGAQVRWAKERHLMAAAYAVNSFPDAAMLRRYGQEGPYDGRTKLGALRNVGYSQARFNLDTMAAAGLNTPVVWLDVEPVPIFEWSSDKRANAAVIEGAAKGYTDAGRQIGAYSTQLLWQTVVGDLQLGLPEWRAAGQTSRAEALRRCGPERMFQGGAGVIAQWVEAGRDQNVTCPGTSQQLYRWFHQY